MGDHHEQSDTPRSRLLRALTHALGPGLVIGALVVVHWLETAHPALAR